MAQRSMMRRPDAAGRCKGRNAKVIVFMSNIKRHGKLVGIAALAASTALSGPVATPAFAAPIVSAERGIASLQSPGHSAGARNVMESPAPRGSYEVAQADEAPAGEAPPEELPPPEAPAPEQAAPEPAPEAPQ